MSLDDEVALLVVHGLLAPARHGPRGRDAEAERMEALEQQLLDRFYRVRRRVPERAHPAGRRRASRPRTASSSSSSPCCWRASGVLAMAETSLVRMNRIKAKSLVDEKRRGARQLARLVENPANFLNPILLLVLICQLVSATLVGIVAEHLFGGLGVVARHRLRGRGDLRLLRGGAEELGRAATPTGPPCSARRSSAR